MYASSAEQRVVVGADRLDEVAVPAVQRALQELVAVGAPLAEVVVDVDHRSVGAGDQLLDDRDGLPRRADEFLGVREVVRVDHVDDDLAGPGHADPSPPVRLRICA
jgi:hypothetical protein